MSGARDHILDAVRKSLGRSGPLPDDQRAELDRHLAGHPRNVVPSRVDRDHSALVDLFEKYATGVHASVVRVAGMAAVPDAVSEYLRQENLPAKVVMAPDPTLEAAPWDTATPILERRAGRPEPADEVGVTSAFAGVAETGTLVALSGPDHPSTLNFLPETHIVVLPAERVVASYEDVWDRIRARTNNGTLPRTVNLITGPSLSGDIEQTLQHGAHGPRRVHIILVNDGPA